MAADIKGKPVHILWDKASDVGVFSGGGWVSGLPLASLQTQDVQALARTASLSTAATQFTVDLGRIRAVDMIATLNHNGTKAGKRRAILSNQPDFGVLVYDTGWEGMRARSTIWGVQAFGELPFDGYDDGAYPSGLIDLHISATTVYGRYLKILWDDQTNPAGYLQAGRFLAGPATRLRAAYGLKIRSIDPSERRRTRGGLVVVRQRPRYREISAEFDHLTEAQSWGQAFEMDRQLGKSGDFLLVTDPSDDVSVRFRRAMYASLTDTAGVVATSRRRSRWAISAEELV